MLRYLVFLLVPAVACAQTAIRPALQLATSSIFQQKVAVPGSAGRPYRLTMRAQADTAGGSWASLGVVYLKAGRYKGRTDLYDQPKPLNRVRSARWLPYTVAGRLPSEVDTLLLTPNVNGNGRFAFDDFRLEVQQPGGAWQAVPVANGNFEAPAAADSSATRLPVGWQHFTGPVAGYTYRVAPESGSNHYLLLRGAGLVPYGHNPAAGHFQKVNGVKIYYETYGQGPPLLLLHGNGGSIAEMRYQIADLAHHYQVVAVDTREQGQSGGSGKAPLTYDLFAADMAALLDALHLPAADVVGWSDGGNTGLSLALHHPARVKKLVTMGANLYADTTAVAGNILRYFADMARRAPAPARRLARLVLDYPHMTPAELATIKAPTLVLAGEHDVIKEAHTRLIAASIPGAKLLILPGLSHYAPQENPSLFNETMLQFLQGK